MNFKVKALLGAASLALMAGSASAADLACLITKNNTNPFFVKMKEGAEAAAKAAGLDFQAYAGEKDGDAAPQSTAIENCVAAGAKGILITPSNDSVGPALKDARAAGILVIALDTPLADTEAQDITFATDNFEAGLLIGKWAAATMGDTSKAKIAMLDINKDNISVDVARDTGFLVGFGIEVPDLTVMGSETDPRVIGHESSDANPEGGLR
ncbi:MAG: sugar ABC transporter, partial [Rhodobacteraceae bacterium PARR1]